MLQRSTSKAATRREEPLPTGSAEEPLPTGSAQGDSQPIERTAIDARGAWLTIIGVVTAVFALRSAQELFVPLALAIFLSYALEPVTAMLVRWSLPRALAAALLLLSVVGVVQLGIYTLSDDALAVANNLPVAARRFRSALQRQRQEGPTAIDQAHQIATEIEKSAAAAVAVPHDQGVVRVEVADKPIDVRNLLWHGSLSVAALVTSTLLLLFLTYFFMASGDLFKRKVVTIAGPSLSRQRVTVQVLDEISLQVQRFLFIQLIAGTIVGIVSWAAFYWIGLQQAAVWGLAAGVLNTIPYFGPFIVATGLLVAGLVQFGSLGPAALLAGVAIAITGLEGFLLSPLLVGRAARMNEVAVFVSLMFWGWLWGAVGMLLAVPIMMAFKSVCDRVEALHPVGELLGD